MAVERLAIVHRTQATLTPEVPVHLVLDLPTPPSSMFSMARMLLSMNRVVS